MTQNPSETSSFPCSCPGCATMAGFPYQVSTDPTHSESVRVNLRCRQCNKEWQVTRTVAAVPPVLQPTAGSNTC